MPALLRTADTDRRKRAAISVTVVPAIARVRNSWSSIEDHAFDAELVLDNCFMPDRGPTA
jgi:hypothetical protein